MALHVIEGTWEEIESRKAELIGRQLRVTIKPERTIITVSTVRPNEAPVTAQTKQLKGFGAFKGKIGSSAEFAQEKKAEIEREERHL